MKRHLLIWLAATALALPVWAQQAAVPASAPSASSADLTDGEVRKVDKGAGKITLKHGEIRNLEMPPMTMVFKVKDAALLDKLQTGDRVRFKVEKLGASYVVTEIEAAK
jgi:Cu/Ag efflux protein CusF